MQRAVEVFGSIRDSLANSISDCTDWLNTFSSTKKSLIVVGSLLLSTTTVVGLYCLNGYYALERLPGYKPLSEEGLAKWKAAKELRLRIVNLDGGLPLQQLVTKKYNPEILDLHEWGPAMRIDCFWWTLWGFESALTRVIGRETDDDVENKPLITFFGANDFHHVALSLIRRFRAQQYNVVIFDNHPDWFKFYPLGLHCGCWYSHVMALPTVQYGFHFGGDSGEFEDTQGFHPWRELIDGRLAVFPTTTKWKGLKWDQAKHVETLRNEGMNITRKRVRELLEPHRARLEQYPLYITLDKDCMQRKDNLQNWNSGSLSRDEVIIIIETLLEFSKNRLVAMDITGDFTKVNVCGHYRHYLHATQHDEDNNEILQTTATPNNQITNLELLKCVEHALKIPQNFRG